MLDLLRTSPLLVLFFVTAVGYSLGRVRIFGLQLGVAAILFVGLGLSAVDSTLTVPELLPQLGLVLFVYAIGLGNGPEFFRAFQQKDKRQIWFVLLALCLPAVLSVPFFFLLPLDAATVAGVYTGAETTTAGLAAVLDMVSRDAAVTGVVVGYSLSYPLGVLGRILVIALLQKRWRIDFAAEAHELRQTYPIAQEIAVRTIAITRSAVTGRDLRDLQREHGWDVLFGRIQRGDSMTLISGDTRFQLGDVIAVAGPAEKIEALTADLGQPGDDTMLTDQSIYARRRFFVSNSAVVGQPIITLNLKEKYGAIVSRIRRGDTDILATNDTILEAGDRVHVVGPRRQMNELSDLFGDSYVAVSQVNLLSLGFGITFGLLLGMVPIPLPGGISFRLGFAGGPLVVALILGALRRTGTLVWTLPYSVNQTLQQIGLILLLAGIGIRSGGALVDAFAGLTGWLVLGTAAVVVTAGMVINMIIGYKWLGIHYSLLMGMLASQPAVLSYVSEKTGNQLPQIGFALSFSLAVIVKVVVAQLLVLLLTAF